MHAPTPRRLTNLLALALILLLPVGLLACSSADPSEAQDDIDDTVSSENTQQTVEGTGTIRFLAFEGGFYGIVADDSTRYDPGELDEAFREDGLRVRFELTPQEGMMTMRQWGTPADVHRLEKIESE